MNSLTADPEQYTGTWFAMPRTFAAAMLRLITLPLIFSLLAMPLFAQPADQLNRTDDKGRKQGQWARSWDNGNIRYQGQFKDDRPFGEFKHFDEEGQLTTIQQYDPDGLVSRATHLHADGTPMATGKYQGQVKDSTWNYYDEEGRSRKVEHFKNGVLHGEVITYYPNGQVADRSIFENGVINGRSKSWFATGIPASEDNYVNGVSEGKSITYYPSGKKEYEGNMVKGERDGTWFHFNNDGSLHMQLVYKGGKLVKESRENGTFKEYYPDEQLKSEVTYKKGKKEGAFVDYYDNGTWSIRQLPADPVSGAKADVERVLQGQTKKREGMYKNDELHGDVKEYDEKGRTLKVTKYEAGTVVSENVKR